MQVRIANPLPQSVGTLEVCLASLSVAAATAVMGRFAHPAELAKPEAVLTAMRG